MTLDDDVEDIMKKFRKATRNRKPRKDVLLKLGLITTEFLRCEIFPKYPASEVNTVINKVLGGCDSRVIRDYKKTVLPYCNVGSSHIDNPKYIKNLGEIDVSFFVNLIPKQHIGDFSPNTTTS